MGQTFSKTGKITDVWCARCGAKLSVLSEIELKRHENNCGTSPAMKLMRARFSIRKREKTC